MGDSKSGRIIVAAPCVFAALLILAAFLPASAGAGGKVAAETADGHGMGWLRTPPGEYAQCVIDTSGRQFKASADLSSQMPPVGDQGDQSSCVAWAIGYYYKSWQEKQEHATWDLAQPEYQFSPAFVYNLSNEGVDDGISFQAAFDVLERKGGTDLAEFPYDDADYTTQPDAADRQAALPYRIKSNWGYLFYQPGEPPYDINPNDIGALKAWLDAGEPFVAGIYVYADFPDIYPTYIDNPYYDYDGTSSDTGGHALCIVGYDDNANPDGADADHKGGFLAVNSWGTDWNASTPRPGYVYLSYDFMKRYALEAWQMDDLTTPDTPRVDSVTPDHGGAGTSVEVTGVNFGTDRRASHVTIDGTEADIDSWTNSSIVLTTPDPTTSGPLVVYDWEGTASNSAAFHGAPTLDSLDKAGGTTGETVTLTGTLFGSSRGDSYVSFGEVRAGAYTVWTDTSITCEVPAAAAGLVDVTVTTEGGSSGGLPFSVVPTLDGMWPAEGAPGTEVTLYGTGFGAGRGSSAVMFDGVPAADYNLWSEGEIKCLAPDAGAGTRAVGVHTSGGDSGTIDFDMTPPSVTWYLAEGSTDGGMETWVLVQNPGGAAVAVDLTLMTDAGEQKPAALQGVAVAAGSRVTFNLNSYVTTYNVSTLVEAGDNVVCERAMYGNDRAWAHESVGVTSTSSTWYLAEGCTDGGMETWVLVQNPNAADVTVTLELQDVGSGGAVIADVPIAANSRRSFNLGESLTTYNVSTLVASRGGNVVCERAMYGNGGAWAHDSAGAKAASETWYLAEGCTDGGFETWVLVQNPGDVPVEVDLELQTDQGSRTPEGLRNVHIEPRTRQSFNLGEYVTTYNVSTLVRASGGGVVCERAMYGNGRGWAHESVGAAATASTWYLAEGCTDGGMETWVLVQNPNAAAVTVSFTLMTDKGPVNPPGLTGVAIAGNSRRSFDLGFYALTYDVSAKVVSTGGGVVCERAMYGNGRTWAHDSVGYAPR